ncbi:phosphatase [Algoriphagus aestuarii]|nr:phosphatase [Algoriphagus aestuarii]
MKLAAVDIGSNAIRMQITKVTFYEGANKFKKIEYLRFPLRLGLDVFHSQKISDKNRRKFIKLMKAFKILIDLYEVDDYMACATSAMRESVNGKDIVQEVKEEIGLKIIIIDGNREAELIHKSLLSLIDEKPYLHIDVGGGSTELNIYKNYVKIASKSFQIGSVRALEDKIQEPVWLSMKKFVEKNVPHKARIISIGTGGNISKIFELSGPKTSRKYLEIEKVKETIEKLESYPFEERVNKLNLNEDRADVIIPAGKIYLRVMEMAKSQKILVPDLGLKDGMMQLLFEKKKSL